jgi:hypothetical protein
VSVESVAMNQPNPFALSLSKGSEETSRLHRANLRAQAKNGPEKKAGKQPDAR